MKLDYKKIINIKNKKDLMDFDLDKPIFQNNYLFHYLIIMGNLTALKLTRFPVYIENNDGLNGFHLASKEGQIETLMFLIDSYPEYIYNRNVNQELFTEYLPFESFTDLIKKYPKLDWSTLIDSKIIKLLLVNLKYTDLNDFIDVYKISPTKDNQYLFSLLKNTNITTDNKIKLLDKYSDQDINIKNDMGEGLVLIAIILSDIDLFNYLLKRNVDLDYYSIIKTDNPLRLAIATDIISNSYNFTPKIIDIIKIKNPEFYRANNKYGDNLVHTTLYIRINRSNQLVQDDGTVPAKTMKSINYTLDLELLEYGDSEIWNQLNIEKLSPLDLITNLDFNIYSKVFVNKKIGILKSTLDRIVNQKDSIDNRWIKLFSSLPEYKETSTINMDDFEYAHCNLYQSRFKDVGIFSLYLKDTHKELLIPNTTSYQLNNLTFDGTFPFSDDIIAREPVFPWIISYYSDNEYYIHPYLNNIINSERRNNDKRFGLVFLNLIYENILHANILIYDFKNMTVERFEPYGNTNFVEYAVDDLLEEELTWNTGLRYVRPSEYLPYAGFQTISDENNLLNKKAGDFGGYCLAWCLWYLETKLKNPDIDSKTLVNKMMSRLNNLDIKYSEYIRNYANKVNNKRVRYMETIGIDPKIISNSHLTMDTNIKVTELLIGKFKNK